MRVAFYLALPFAVKVLLNFWWPLADFIEKWSTKNLFGRFVYMGGAYWSAHSTRRGLVASYFLVLLFSCSVVPDSFRPHGLQDARVPCPSPPLRARSNSCPLNWWGPSNISICLFTQEQLSISTVKVKESEVAQSCPTFCDPVTVAYQAPPSIGFSRQEYWSRMPFLTCLSMVIGLLELKTDKLGISFI